ncbi:MAG TPA: glycosyltransferase family 2 protein [Mycobacteriales bacterium]|jgi:glycosyltransferase involved in cell wall biosynthesis|nr:glycosyltransferase family 2 protein [Mycobacteriales bacterium]
METSPGATQHPPVSVVLAVRNEQRSLLDAVSNVLAQDYDGALEVVIAVGPSTDETARIATDLTKRDSRVRTVANPTGRTPAGLNAAIAAARHDVIARVDGHAMLPPHYIRVAVELLVTTGADNVGGVMAPEGSGPFQQAVARAMCSPIGVGSTPFRTSAPAGPASSVYLGVFRRAALERVGGYDESYLRGQDWELNHRIRKTGGLVYFSPELKVVYHPRADMRSFARQYFHTGRWRRAIMRQHRETVTLRYLAPPAMVVAVGAGTLGAVAGRPAGLALPGGYLACIVAASLATGRGLPAAARLRLPLVYATMHGAWGLGFLTSPVRLAAAAVPVNCAEVT